MSSDGGALFLREIDSELGILQSISGRLVDPRNPYFTKYSLGDLLRTRLLLIAMGYPDQDDADLLRSDPAIAAAACPRRGVGAIGQPLASQPTMSRLTDYLSHHRNRRELRDGLLNTAVRSFSLRRRHRHRYATLDLDSTDIKTHGAQQGGTYNGYFKHTCYHPLIATVHETGDLVGAWLRRGNAASSRGATEFALPIVDRLRGTVAQMIDIRGDAAFATPRFMTALDERGIRYVFRLKRNARLNQLAAPFLTRPVGRPPNHRREWYHELEYRAASWEAPRRVVLVVIDDPNKRFMGQVDLEYFFFVTSHAEELMPAQALVEFYRQRGTMETWIGEFKRDVGPRLSSPNFVENQATFSLFALAYQWLHLARVFTGFVDKRDCRPTIGTFRLHLLKVATVFLVTGRHLTVRIMPEAHRIWSAALAKLDHSLKHLTAATGTPPAIHPSSSSPIPAAASPPTPP